MWGVGESKGAERSRRGEGRGAERAQRDARGRVREEGGTERELREEARGWWRRGHQATRGSRANAHSHDTHRAGSGGLRHDPTGMLIWVHGPRFRRPIPSTFK